MEKNIKHGQIWLGVDNNTIYYVVFGSTTDNTTALTYNTNIEDYESTIIQNLGTLLEEDVAFNYDLPDKLQIHKDKLSKSTGTSNEKKY
jgi:hypothetical protein